MTALATGTTPTTTVIEPIKVIADIFQTELSLVTGKVMLENQKVFITGEGLHIVLQYVAPSKPIGGHQGLITVDGVTCEIQETSFLHQIQVDLYSYDGTARARKEEVMMALGSIYSQQKQGENFIQIARNIAPFNDVSTLEGTARLNRFVTTIAVTALHRKVKATTQYYDTFTEPEVHTNA